MIKIQAHRGASCERPENTLAAFQRAIELKADGIELDVYLLSDGTLAVHHDNKLGRCESPDNNLTDYTAKNIKSFSIGEKFSSQYKSEKVPFLSEVLELIKDTDMFLNVELKHADGFLSQVGDKTVELLDKYNMKNRCILSSFHHYFLRDLKQKYPEYKVGILYGDLPLGIDLIPYCIENHFDAIHPNFKNLKKETVQKCHQNGIAVNIWTADSRADIEKMVKMGVDSVITNNVVNAIDVIRK